MGSAASRRTSTLSITEHGPGKAARSRVPSPSKRVGIEPGVSPPGRSVIYDLNEAQIEEFRDAFVAFDDDGSGTMDQGELRHLFESLGQNPTDEEIRSMVDCADADGSGTVDFVEFATLMAHLMARDNTAEKLQERLVGAFKVFDANGDGSISFDEMRTIVWNLGEDVSLADVDDILRQFDDDGDGSIDYQEFARGIVEERLLAPRKLHPSSPGHPKMSTHSPVA